MRPDKPAHHTLCCWTCVTLTVLMSVCLRTCPFSVRSRGHYYLHNPSQTIRLCWLVQWVYMGNGGDGGGTSFKVSSLEISILIELKCFWATVCTVLVLYLGYYLTLCEVNMSVPSVRISVHSLVTGGLRNPKLLAGDLVRVYFLIRLRRVRPHPRATLAAPQIISTVSLTFWFFSQTFVV